MTRTYPPTAFVHPRLQFLSCFPFLGKRDMFCGRKGSGALGRPPMACESTRTSAAGSAGCLDHWERIELKRAFEAAAAQAGEGVSEQEGYRSVRVE